MRGGRAGRRGALLRGGRIGLALLLRGQVVPDSATHHRAGDRVVAREMTADAADGSAFQATRGMHGHGRDKRDKNERLEFHGCSP